MMLPMTVMKSNVFQGSLKKFCKQVEVLDFVLESIELKII